MALFDSYVVVDWSARSVPSPVTPSRDAIWVAVMDRGGTPDETYCRTRSDATSLVRTEIHSRVGDGRRVLVGFDFPYGYPAGLGAHVSPRLPTWRGVWEVLGAQIVDDDLNANNRFQVAADMNRRVGAGPGPFWGCPMKAAGEHLTTGMTGVFNFPYATPSGPLRRLRVTEAAMRGVQETWKLMGAGCVGSQALLGIPRVRSLRDDPALSAVSRVWPFETGFASRPVPAEGPFVLHAEIWPGIIPRAELRAEATATGAVHDQAQVRLMCRWAEAQDDAGTLGGWFDATELDEATRLLAVEQEGWILGCRA